MSTEEIKPFHINKLTDVIDEEVLRMIQTGLGERLGIPLTIMEKRWNEWHRIDPVMPFEHFCDFCRYLRGEPNSETDMECVNWDAKKAEEILKSNSHEPEHYPCHTKLRDVVFPIVIDDKVVAVLFSGQKRFEGMDEEVKKQARKTANLRFGRIRKLFRKIAFIFRRQRQPERMDDEVKNQANKHKRLRFSKMKRLLKKMDVVTEADMDEFMDKLAPMVEHITTLASQNYVNLKRLQEEKFLDELSSYFEYTYEKDISPLWGVLEKVLQRVIEFTDTTKVAMFLVNENEESDTLNCKVAAGLSKDIIPDFPGFKVKELEIGVSTQLNLETDWPTLFKNIDKSLKDLAYYLISISVKPRLNGFLVFGNFEETDSVNIESAITVEVADLISKHVQRAYFEFTQSQRNKEREAHIQELEESEKEREKFIAEAAHSLRGPMQSILSESEYLAHRCVKMCRQDEEIMKSTNKVSEETEIMKNKLDNALISGDMERRVIEYDLKENSLVSLIEKCANQLRSVAKRERDIDIIVQVDNLPDFKFDWERLETVFMNLLDNAIKYSHGGKNIYVRGTVDGNEVKVEIEDFGLGIKEEEKGKIFRKYYRAELKDRRRFIPGTGIGLTVARKIVEDHDGRIFADSRPAGGIHHSIEKVKAGESFITTFIVVLPY